MISSGNLWLQKNQPINNTSTIYFEKNVDWVAKWGWIVHYKYLGQKWEFNTCKTQCGTVLQCYSSEFSFINSSTGKWTHVTKSVINKSIQWTFCKQDTELQLTNCIPILVFHDTRFCQIMRQIFTQGRAKKNHQKSTPVGIEPRTSGSSCQCSTNIQLAAWIFMAFIKSCSVDSRNCQSPKFEVVHETKLTSEIFCLTHTRLAHSVEC